MRRYGSLTPAERLRVGLVFLVVQGAVWLLVPGWGVRAALAVLTAAVLAVGAATRPPPRGSNPR